MLAGILSHLRAVLPADVTPQVDLVEDIDKLIDWVGEIDSGSVVVVPWQELATANPIASGGFRQRVAVQFLVGVLIRTYDQRMGEERALEFDSHVAPLEAALAGWEPPGAIAQCQLVSAESSPLTTGVSIYVQTWETARFLTGANP